MSEKRIVIVIPIYRAVLEPYEEAALGHNLSVLSAWPAVFLKPEGLDIGWLQRQYPQVGVMEVSRNWLGTDRGIAGYNDMMMSASFYSRFLDYRYMLICHVDAWVFRDDLGHWLNCGYDHVAAPWSIRTRYRYWPLKLWLLLRQKGCHVANLRRRHIYGRLGNGGFSLRRVETFMQVCKKHEWEKSLFMEHADNPIYNEDVFFSIMIGKKNVPSFKEALTFSFDEKPEVFYKFNRKTLPMACHGFQHPERTAFWSRFIPCV